MDCVRANVVAVRAKLIVFSKVIVFGQNGCVRAMWLCSDNLVVFGQNYLYSGKLVVIRQSGCNRATFLFLGKSGCVGA